MKYLRFYLIILTIVVLLKQSNAIWCYQCTSATPGCAEHFRWWGIGYWGMQCPEEDDICVKLIERKGASTTITRDCLSSFKFRTDIPADHYEGCRTAAKDVRLAHYVFNNSISQLDIRRDYFDETTFCFCFLDHRCNGSPHLITSIPLILSSLMGMAALAHLMQYL